MLVAFLALGAYVYFVELERPPASETPANERLVELEGDEITGFTVVFEGEVTELSRASGGEVWQVTAPIASPADETQVSSMASALASLDIRRIIDEAATDLEPFGLVEPIVEVGFAVSGDAPARRLLIGDTTPTGGERYAKLDDSDRIILIASHLNTTFGKSTFDLRDKTILSFESANVDEFEIESGGSVLGFAKSQNEWRLVSPWDVRADFGVVEGTVGRLSTGLMRSVASEGIDETDNTSDDRLAEYGLAQPHITTTARLGSSAATLLIGHPTNGGDYYAKDASRPVIFTIEGTLVSDLEREASEYRKKDLFEFRPFNASRLEIEQPEGIIAFEKVEATGDDAEDTWTRVSPEPGDVDRSAIDDLLAKLSNLRAESFVESLEDAEVDAGDPFATVRVRFGDDPSQAAETEEEQIILWRSGETAYGTHGEEPGAASLNTGSVDDAFEALETVQTGES